ncbi:MAG: T9SS type A sorting domain-containing protein [Bacteroidia bacterium]|nr:T9SS type A sorting domain-containing protein [Bacteroidia bacterium]
MKNSNFRSNNGVHHLRDLYSVQLTSYSISCAGDTIALYGETAVLNISLQNTGQAQITNGIAVLTVNDPDISISQSMVSFGTLDSAQSVSFPDAFEFYTAVNIPSVYPVNFTLTFNTDQGTYTNDLLITCYAPQLHISQVIVDDGNNGILESGETANLNVIIQNSSPAAYQNSLSDISSTDPYVTINNINGNFIVEGNSQDTLVINVTIDAATPAGHLITFSTDNSSVNGYIFDSQFAVVTRQLSENFETGDFSLFPWTMAGDLGWTITQSNVYDGLYSARSGAITHQQTSSLIIQLNVISDGNISFYRKVSCEDDPYNDNYDYLVFRIDGAEMHRWDGEQDWTLVSYPVTSGTHDVEWSYVKDYSISEGQDAAWIDDISFPPVYFATALSVNITAQDTPVCAGQQVVLTAWPNGGTGNYSFLWDSTFVNASYETANPAVTPLSPTTYSVTVTDDSSQVISQYYLNVHPLPDTPVINAIDIELFSDASSGNQWYNENGPVAGANSQFLYDPPEGEYYVIVTSDFGCVSDTSNHIYFTAGIDENISGLSFLTAEPNPFSSSVIFYFNDPGNHEFSLLITDISGRSVRTSGFSTIQNESSNIITWDGRNDEGKTVPDGIYLARLLNGSTIRTIKIVKMSR